MNKNIERNNLPILILLNKIVIFLIFFSLCFMPQDIKVESTEKEIFKKIYNTINYKRLDNKRFLVMEISALKG